MGRLILVTGGTRSGKTACAEGLVGGPAAEKVTYLATAEPRDEEMAERIRRHQARRPPHWQTVESPLQADRELARLARRPGWVLLDCLTLFLANLLEAGEEEESILGRIEAMAHAARFGQADVVVISNEVGWGIVPATPLARRFRDLAGLANQVLARQADEVYLTVAGLAQRLK